MAITRLYHCKDFELKWKWNRSRLKDQCEGFYTVIWRSPDGKQCVDLECAFTTQVDAKKFISAKVKHLNAILKKAHEQGIIHLESLR